MRLVAASLLLAAGHAAERYAFDIYGADQGLRTLGVNILHQDRKGYLWIGTGNGLYRFDGHRFLDPEPDGPVMGEATVEGESGVLRLLGTGDIYRSVEKVWTNEVQEGYRGDSVRATQQHFVDCLRTGVPFESGGREYLKTFRAVEAAYESIAESRAIPL